MVTDGLNINLTVRAGSFERTVEFEAKPGITALIGPSGCGKTTTLHSIAGLLRPAAGRIVFENEIWFDKQSGVNMPAQQRKVGYVFQNMALFPHLTVRDNVLFGLPKSERSSRDARLERLSALFHFAELLERRPAQLSGGQSQRIALARALAGQPRLVLLDEPLNALDERSREEIAQTLKQIQQEQKLTILFVTHFLEQSRPLADAIVDMTEA
jgi:molybdate transport system ATP-binding protein